jgi:hypothetical protein
MYKTLRTMLVAAFALLLAGAAMASTGDQPVTGTETAATQAVEAHAFASPAVPGMQAPLFAVTGQAQGEQCGDRVCPPNKYCCNASCEICAEPDQGCIQITCD